MGWGDGTSAKVLTKQEGLSSVPRIQGKKNKFGTVTHSYNPSTTKGETGRFLMLADQSYPSILNELQAIKYEQPCL